MEFIDRFAPLMSESLHFADTPEGHAAGLDAVHDRLSLLAEEELRLPASIGRGMTVLDLEHQQHALQLCRFAVYAWIDELMLNSGRHDAMSWMQYMFQSARFHTASAGKLFFDNMEMLLDRILATPQESPSTTLAHKLSLIAQLPPSESDDTRTLRVYARCLLYGFKGIFYEREKELGLLLNASRQLLMDSDQGSTIPEDSTLPSGKERLRAGMQRIESLAFILFPLGVVGLFALFCANILADTPLPQI